MRTGILLLILTLALPAASQHSQDLTLSWGGLGLRGDVGPTWSNPSQGNAWTLGNGSGKSTLLRILEGRIERGDPTALPAE